MTDLFGSLGKTNLGDVLNQSSQASFASSNSNTIAPFQESTFSISVPPNNTVPFTMDFSMNGPITQIYQNEVLNDGAQNALDIAAGNILDTFHPTTSHLAKGFKPTFGNQSFDDETLKGWADFDTLPLFAERTNSRGSTITESNPF